MSAIAFAETIQLVPDGTLFIHILIIILMVFILNRTLFKPINQVLGERERHTKGSSRDAQGILHSVDEKLSLYEQTLRAARAESYRLLEEQRANAMRERQQRLESVKKELEANINQEKSQIESQTVAARSELEAEAQRLAISIKSQILGR